MNNQVNGIELKYPDMKNMSRSERDALMFQQLEAMSNELARLGKKVDEIARKIWTLYLERKLDVTNAALLGYGDCLGTEASRESLSARTVKTLITTIVS